MTLLLFDGYLIMRDEKGKFMSKRKVISIDINQLNQDKNIVDIVELPNNVTVVDHVIQFDKKFENCTINKLVLIVRTS